MSKTTNLNPPGAAAADAALGRRTNLGARGGGVHWRDANDVVVSSTATFPDFEVDEDDDGGAVIRLRGTGGSGSGSGSGTGGGSGGTVGGGVGSFVGTPVRMLNNSGEDLPAGSVVVTDETANDAVTTTTTVGDSRIPGVLAEAIVAGAIGPVLFPGSFAGGVIVTGDAPNGYYLRTSAVAGAAEAVLERGEGTFAVVTREADVFPIVESAVVTDSSGSVTSLAIDLPLATVPVGRVLFLALYRATTVTTAVTLTGWTRIGSTSGFWYYYRVATGTDPATATWTTASPAVAIVAILDARVDATSIVDAQAFEATTAAAALSGLAATPHFIIAGVQDEISSVADWRLIGAGASEGA